MGYGFYYNFEPYVPVAKKIDNAKTFVKKRLGNKANPVVPQDKKIVQTFWGQAWCNNLESYTDYENRMPRGRTYIRNGSVVHLEINKGKILAYVAGTHTYKIEIKIDPIDKKLWNKIKKKCTGEIGSVVELLQGKLSKNVLTIVTDKNEGLFPKPKEIKFNCSCPDFASMCKHVAAALYGVGVILDKEPELFFKLRGVNHLELIGSSVNVLDETKDADTLDNENLESIFGINLSDSLDNKADKADNSKNKKSTKVKSKTVSKSTDKIKTTKTIKSASKKKTAKKTVKKATKKTVKKTAKKAVKKTVKNKLQ